MLSRLTDKIKMETEAVAAAVPKNNYLPRKYKIVVIGRELLLYSCDYSQQITDKRRNVRR
jgi:hypothetical protein